ncbi:hypothetical protein BHM03_00004038 [Ensete ventricosum]|nr:hypothetical protein BHM03_00004038 [Ensete ventricosum]
MNLPNVFGFAEGQPESIVRDIEEMVRSYVEKVNKISLSLFSMYLRSTAPMIHAPAWGLCLKEDHIGYNILG